MNEFKQDRKQRKSRKKQADEIVQSSSKLGIATVVVCISILLATFIVTKQFDQKEQPQPVSMPTEAVNASAISSSWSCPISGNPANNDTLLLVNPSGDQVATVKISAYDGSGVILGSFDARVPANKYHEVHLDVVGATDTSSLLVESVSGSVLPYRSINLSDGNEFDPCIKNFSATADFPNLETIRNSNAQLVLSNPYDLAVVIDVQAGLTDPNPETPKFLVDEERGIIVPAHGRTTLDLQSIFGRYPVVSIHINSRSGFFAAEVLQTFSGAESSQGQTIVSSTPKITNTKSRFWTGVQPTRIVAQNSATKANAANLLAIANDKRTVAGDPKNVLAGTTTVLDNVGAEFGSRTIDFSVEKAFENGVSMYFSWMHVGSQSVSSGSGANQLAKTSLVPFAAGDLLHMFNPGNKKTSVKIKIFGSTKSTTIRLDAKSYSSVTLESLNLSADSIIQVESDESIYVSSSDALFTRYASGIEVVQ